VPTKAATKSPALTKRQLNLISRALADPTRFEVFQRIAAGTCVACSDLREAIAVTAPTLSHHIKELETAGLVESARNGKFMNLTLRSDIWRAYLKKLSEIEPPTNPSRRIGHQLDGYRSIELLREGETS